MTDRSYVRPTVAIACEETRTRAIGRALELVHPAISRKVSGKVIIKPNFLSSVEKLASTQADAVLPVLNMLREMGHEMTDVTIAEGASRSTRQAFDNFGYRWIAAEFGVQCADLNRDSYSHEFEIVTESKGTDHISCADSIIEADTVISVAVAKTHDAATVTLSVKNMMGCLRRVQRPRMHGIQLGHLAEHGGEILWNTIEDHSWIIKLIAAAVFGVVRIRRKIDGYLHPEINPGLRAQIGAISENLARLGEVVMPDIAVIDAFDVMEGDGPGSGTCCTMKLAVAGTDPVACDAIMALLMGFDPMGIGYLRLLHDRGLGIADPDMIGVVGADPQAVRSACKPHRNYHIQQQWRDAWNEMFADV